MTRPTTRRTQAHDAIDTLLWLGAGVVAFFLILLWWLAQAGEPLVASLRRVRAARAAPPRFALPTRPAGV